MNSFKTCRPMLLIALVAISLHGCAKEPEPEAEFETVEVGGRATDNLTPEDDVAESVASHGLTSQLPAGFPTDVPLPASSSVLATGRGSVTFGTEDSAASVRADLEDQLARAGWASTSNFEAGAKYTKGARSISVAFTEEADRTLIRYRY